MNKGDYLTSLIANNFSLKFKHWTADRLTNEHKYIGDLYDTVSGLLDELVEVSIGMGITLPEDEEIAMNPCGVSALELIQFQITILNEIESGETDTGILTLTGDIRKELNHAIYFLKS
jgi:hypothetical protein